MEKYAEGHTVSIETSFNPPNKEEKLGCFDIYSSQDPTAFHFIMLTISTLFFCLISAYLQELIFQLDGFKPFGFYLTLIEFTCFSVFSVVELQFKSDKKRRIPLNLYGVIAFLTVTTMGLSHISIAYINYPTKVMFKCCKLIPVMIGGLLIQGRRYSLLEVLGTICMCIGLLFFVLADNKVSPTFNTYGIFLISIALISDGVIANVQEKTIRQYSSNSSEVVLYSYSIGCIYILAGLVLSGVLLPAYEFCQKYPVETYGYAVIYSSFCYLGVKSVLSLLATYGALVAVTVTTCRKALTIVISFTFFNKPFTSQYVWSGLMVLLGIYLNVYSRNQESIETFIIKKVDVIKHYIGYKTLHEEV